MPKADSCWFLFAAQISVSLTSSLVTMAGLQTARLSSAGFHLPILLSQACNMLEEAVVLMCRRDGRSWRVKASFLCIQVAAASGDWDDRPPYSRLNALHADFQGDQRQGNWLIIMSGMWNALKSSSMSELNMMSTSGQAQEKFQTW